MSDNGVIAVLIICLTILFIYYMHIMKLKDEIQFMDKKIEYEKLRKTENIRPSRPPK